MNPASLASLPSASTSHPAARRLGVVAAFLVLCGATLASAAPHVKDDGKFFGAEAVQRAEQKLADLQAKTGRKVIVETFAEPPADVQSQIIADASKRDQVFERFAGERARSLGVDVYVMANRVPGYLRVEENNALQSTGLPAVERREIAEGMLASFRSRNFDAGLTTGVERIVTALTSGPIRGAAAAGDATTPQARPRAEGGGAVPASPTRRDEQPTGPGAADPQSTNSLLGGGCCTLIGVLLIVGLIVMFLKKRLNPNRGAPPMASYGGGGYPPGQPGYGQPGYGRGGGFGRGMAGGLLGGVLGGMLGNQWARGNDQGSSDPAAGAGGTLDDPSTRHDTGYSGSGGSFDAGPPDASSGDGGGFDGGGDFSGDGGDF